MNNRETKLASLLDEALRIADEINDSPIGCHLSAAIDALERRVRAIAGRAAPMTA